MHPNRNFGVPPGSQPGGGGGGGFPPSNPQGQFPPRGYPSAPGMNPPRSTPGGGPGFRQQMPPQQQTGMPQQAPASVAGGFPSQQRPGGMMPPSQPMSQPGGGGFAPGLGNMGPPRPGFPSGPPSGGPPGSTGGLPRQGSGGMPPAPFGRGPPPSGPLSSGPPSGGPGFSGPPFGQQFPGRGPQFSSQGPPTGAPGQPPRGFGGPPGPGQQAPPFGGPPGPGQPGPPQFGGPPGPGQPGPPQFGGPPSQGSFRGPPAPGQGPPGPGGYFPPGQPGPPGPQFQQGAPGYGAPGQQMQQQQPKQRIDPNQIPRPIASTERIQYIARGHTVTMPPPASSDYVCVDEGCCNPRFIRPTLNHVPINKEIAKQCGLPLAAVICPLAELKEDELPIPLVDFGPQGPLRCTRCRAYVNTFTKFIQGGRKFVCNICTLHNETPRDYYCSVDQNGMRRDIQERAELSRGSVDYVVPSAYTVRPPQEPIFVFVLDVSLFSFQTSLAPAALNAIKYILPALAQNKRKKIGIVTFDSTVHYYRMDHAKSISINICPDVEEPVAPLPPSSWLVSMEDAVVAQEKINDLSEIILKNYSATTKSNAVSGAALWSVADALSTSGGRIILLHAGPPRVGVGKCKREEASGSYGTTKEVELYTSEENGTYEALAKQCAENHISLDVFSVGNPFASLADVGRVCELTGGRVSYLPQFEKEKSSNTHHLTNQLLRLVERDCGYEAVLKIRVSAGLRVEKSYGSFYARTGGTFNVDEMEFAVIDQDRSICVEFAHDENLAEGSDAFIQAALLYTRSDGIRAVRVHNLALPVEPLLSNVFRFADLDATCSVWQRAAAKQIVDRSIMKTTPSAVKDNLVNDCVQVLFNYRKFCASSSSSGQLILPESLKLLPLYTLATLKSRGLRGNIMGNPPRGFIDVRADERVMMLGLLNSLPVEYAVSAVYPKLYSIHDMPEDSCTLDEDGKFILPHQLPPTAEKLEEEGIFLIHSAMFCYMYIGPRVPSALLQELFGTEHVDTAETTLDIWEKTENEPEDGLRERVRTLVEFLNSSMPISQPLEILSKNDWRANRFMSALVEDRTRNDVSYVEFLCQVHKKIQFKFHG